MSGIQLELTIWPLKIIVGGRVAPEAVMHSIAVTHSCLPACFFPRSLVVLSTTTIASLVEPIENPVSSTLKIVLEGYLSLEITFESSSK
jgi:hypothetical protein